MNLLILSDLHLEFSPLQIDVQRADVIILAGDIHVGTQAIPWIDEQFPGLPVIYVLGNHEFYRGEYYGVLQALREAASSRPNLHLLERQSVRIDDVTFFGTTLWTDFALNGDDPSSRAQAHRDVGRGLSDFGGLISIEEQWPQRLFTTQDSERLHIEARTWLAHELAQESETKKVVITHHLPSALSVASRFQGDWLSPGFASRLDDLVGQADLWIHGHTHDSFDYQIGDCRVLCNPRGYKLPGRLPENTHFDPMFMISM
ncbi:Predicted phosphoesterase [Andreprevotia lacus DSM 23236]|jgi:predicted phosphodiesterase|uniref:Predicted phosphoesterase n=1 Tax=Andreprevotia lacus DSM 23236 TaxID=1121001 RepID=A0A1W1XZH6_9NEIS|nr:metallophosphoesterase [Andreprevotia lacus]SMC29379.1 Predicted phosphoesterase [Andreprevotia lacus DSM 23236]